MAKRNPVSDFLKGRGCPARVVRGGLKGLVENWERIVECVAKGYRLGLDDYLNDMDGRQLLEEALAVAPERERERWIDRLRAADTRMKKQVVPAGRCLWGDEVAEAEDWSPEKNWWYFMKPLKGGRELLADIEDL